MWNVLWLLSILIVWNILWFSLQKSSLDLSFVPVFPFENVDRPHFLFNMGVLAMNHRFIRSPSRSLSLVLSLPLSPSKSSCSHFRSLPLCFLRIRGGETPPINDPIRSRTTCAHSSSLLPSSNMATLAIFFARLLQWRRTNRQIRSNEHCRRIVDDNRIEKFVVHIHRLIRATDRDSSNKIIDWFNLTFTDSKFSITATGTRNQVKKDGTALLPYTIITNPKDYARNEQLDPNAATTQFSNNHTTNEHQNSPSDEELSLEYPPQATTESNRNNITMTDSALVARARKTRYDDLPSFSGYPSDDAERYLKSIKNITKANDDSTDQSLLEIARGKLTQSAGAWFDDNESEFTKWSDFETAFRNRYFSMTMISAKFDKLSQRTQRYDESVTAYFDDVITLCKEIDPKMQNTTDRTNICPSFLLQQCCRKEKSIE